MNFFEAMSEVTKMAQDGGVKMYLYKVRNAGWCASSKHWPDWLFKAYPGGRTVLSAEGTKLFKQEKGNEQHG